MTNINTCFKAKNAFAEAGITCNSDCSEAGDRTTTAGAPMYDLQTKRCLRPASNANCNVISRHASGGYINLCYCCQTPQPTPAPVVATTVSPTVTPKDECDVFDIDGFLTECSVEFPTAKQEIQDVHGAMTEEIAKIEAAQTATNEAVATLNTKVEDEMARVDQEQATTNAAVTALTTKVDDEVTKLESAQSDTNDAVAALSAKLDDKAVELNGLIGDVQESLDTMANLREQRQQRRAQSSAFGDFMRLDEDGEDHAGEFRVSMTTVKLLAALLIISLVCTPVLMVWMSMKYFGGRKAANEYAKVGVITESEAEDKMLIQDE